MPRCLFILLLLGCPHADVFSAAPPNIVFVITDAACAFIEENRERPFFAYIPHYAVHSRLEGRAETLAHFKSKSPGKLGHDNALLAAFLANLDTGIGRVPMIARWPGVTAPVSKCDVPVSNIDFYPTFLAVAAAHAPAAVLDGENLLPLFRGESKLQRPALFWHFPGYLDDPVLRGRDPDFRTRPVSVIRKGDWKLHLYHEEWQLDSVRDQLATTRAAELYNIVNDAGKRTDLATTDTAKRDELLDDLLAWMKTSAAVLPTQPNPKYDPAAKARGGKKKASAK